MEPIHAKKSLGQNFLTCDWALSAIIDAANLSSDDTILEIGPGTGVLTRALAPRVKKVIAIEKDERLAAALAQELKSQNITNVEIHEGDILQYIPPLPQTYKIVANIPYYLTARLLRLFLEEQNIKPIHIVLMVQKEVAQRITAVPPHENLLGLCVQTFATPLIIKTVPATCFMPKPKVDSAIITLSDISDNFFVHHHIQPESFFRIIRLGFSHKRKMLINSLDPVADKKTLTQLFSQLNIGPTIRPEELTLQAWALLVHTLK